MKKQIASGAIALLFLLSTIKGLAQTEVLELTLHESEDKALRTSRLLKSFISEEEAAIEQKQAQFSALLPQFSLEGNYRYLSDVPTVSIPDLGVIPFGAHSTYSIGPVLSYTLWDTGASRKAYHGFSRLAESRMEDRKNAEIQILRSVRSAYLRLQLALEELRLVNGALELSRAQERDVALRHRAGATTRLDLLTSRRQVLGYELQFKQKQADLSAGLNDLLVLQGDPPKEDPHLGPPEVAGVSPVLKLDSFQKLLAKEGPGEIPPPDDRQPQIFSQELLAESSELFAASQRAERYPTVQASAKTSLDYPNGPFLERIHQNTISIALSLPLFDGDRIRHLASERRKEAQSARYRADQLRVDLQRDFVKAQELLDRLREQRKLAAEDILLSEEAARLYYESYQAGKTNLIDVQSANLQALQAKFNAARIDAQMLDQFITLKALSGRDRRHG
jgi:outer membrane protein TolC